MATLILPGYMVRQVGDDGDASTAGSAYIFVGTRVAGCPEIEPFALVHHLKDKILLEAPADSDGLVPVFFVAVLPSVDHGLMQGQGDAELRVDEALLYEGGFHYGIDLGHKTIDLAAVRRAD